MTSLLSGSSCCTISASARLLFNAKHQLKTQKNSQYFLRSRVSSAKEDEECNTEECAPDKEVGKVSMEWVAADNTKVVGTFPPRSSNSKRGWTGYIEKDTAGQTNIYSVEPAVYIAESAISSGTAGSSADGSENTAAIVAGIALVSLAAASSVLIQVGSKPAAVVPPPQYSGPSLTYYINKFNTPETETQQLLEETIPSLSPTAS